MSKRKTFKTTTKSNTVATEAKPAPLTFTDNDIAIIGMSCRFPDANNPQAFWENLIAGKDSIREIPEDRWDWREYWGDPEIEDNKTNSKWGGFIDDVDKFDAGFFKVSPLEAQSMDPQQRILLELSWACLENAGYRPSDLTSSKTGVFIGVCNYDYKELLEKSEGKLPNHMLTGTANTIIPNRISYYYNFHGPSVSVDTACASSLVAIHQAIQSLRQGECVAALVGGININCSAERYVPFSNLGMLSPNGRCKTFDAEADGYVRGEGAGLLLVKPLKSARADGDSILALLKGSATNHGGNARTLTSPNSFSQAQVIKDAFVDAHVKAEEVNFIESHGTGTPLGDPMEIIGLKRAFGSSRKGTGYCGISTVKTNIGHLESASGIAGVIKVILSLQNKKLAPLQGFECLNPRIQLKDSPFYLVEKASEWPALKDSEGSELPRRAGVSSFGFGGTNAHVVVEEYSENLKSEISNLKFPKGPYLIVLSAKTEKRLGTMVRNLKDFLKETQKLPHLSEIAYTLQVGREAMEERMGWVVEDVEDLQNQLEAYWEGKGSSDVYRGRVKSEKDTLSLLAEEDVDDLVEKWLSQGTYSKLLNLWVNGLAFDWNKLYGEQTPRRVSLPTYPFVRERYWIEAVRREKSEIRRGQGATLHPLLHANTSTLEEQRFSSVFDGKEFFLDDHRVQRHKVLPGVAYLEMARAAVEQAVGAGEDDAGVLELSNVLWLRPLVVGEESQRVHIGLYPEENGDIAWEVYAEASGEGEAVLHSQGVASRVTVGEVPQLDLPVLRSKLTEERSVEKVYAVFRAMGLDYGPRHRGLSELYTGAGEALAKVRLPESVVESAGDYGLHPSLLDSALQAVISLGSQLENKPALPFALEKLEVYSPCSKVLWACLREAEESTDKVRKLDIDLCDESGKVCVSMRGFSARALEGTLDVFTEQSIAVSELPVGLLTLTPVWQRTTPIIDDTLNRDSRVLVIGASEEAMPIFREKYPCVQSLPLPEDCLSVDRWAEQLTAVAEDGGIDQILWQFPAQSETELNASLIASQRQGVLALFSVIKALLKLGYGERSLGWTVLTTGSQRVLCDDSVDPIHAGVIGLMGSLSKEYRHWSVGVLDLSADTAVPLSDCLGLSCDERGAVLAFREGVWFQQALALAEVPAVKESPYRHGGVYVVLGGAGGIGQVWSRRMIEGCQAQIVWLGRRAMDEEIESKCAALGALGPTPWYIQADAADPEALSQAYAQIKERYGRIDGLVHAAIVLADQSLAQMSLEQFESGLRAKVDTSVCLAEVFGAEDLDFVMFFSSLQSFMKVPGQSNYVAGCTFNDALAQALSRQWSCAVKIMNWGYWGGVGIVADEAHQERMAQAGIGSIEPEEGLPALECLINGQLDQVAFLKTLRVDALQDLSPTERVTVYPRLIAEVSGVSSPPDSEAQAALSVVSAPPRAMETLLLDLLHSQLNQLGLVNDSSTSVSRRASIDPRYRDWLLESRAFLQNRTVSKETLDADAESLWSEWDARSAVWQQDSELKAQVTLLDICLRALPEILSGDRPATDVLFPDSSMDLVEGIYRDNAVADGFNACLGEVLEAYCRKRIAKSGDMPLRILEVGAGTGGTTAGLLPRLEPFRSQLEEYAYTDLSKAFLMHAEAYYAKNAPYLKTRIFDVSKPPASQDMPTDYYDVAIATNVLHATADIRMTLRNVKATLRNGGLLLLNELSSKSLFTHLTFGLLDGWWLYEDRELRIAGSPGLYPQAWARVLEEEGFEQVVFPAQVHHGLGQQIVAAYSNGVVRQQQKADLVATVSHSAAKEKIALVKEKVTPMKAFSKSVDVSREVNDETLRTKSTIYIKNLVSEALKMKPSQIDVSKRLEFYGLDSILVVQLNNRLKQVFDNIKSTLFFEVQTIKGLIDYLLQNQRDRLVELLEVGSEPLVDTQVPVLSYSTKVLSRPNNRLRRSRFMSDRNSLINQAARQAVAVIGLSGRYANVDTVEELWQQLSSGESGIREIPQERWDWRNYFDEEKGKAGKSYSKWGGFLESVDCFDPQFFRISPREAERMDPQERLFLEEAYRSVADAGYTPANLSSERQVSVFVGVMNNYYGQPTTYWSIANRLSYLFDFKGPSLAIDTACSSSLTAIHLATESLQNGASECAIAGGVNLIVNPEHYLNLSAMTMLSSTAECRSFGDEADGFVGGEGVGVVVLKLLDKAIADRDHIYGIIKGSALNHGGKTNGYTVPNPKAQEDVIRRALREANVDPRTISYIEAHGTGTKLGDPIEIAGLSKAFGQDDKAGQYCAIGSVKSNIGHCESAAGIAGLTKVLLQLKHRKLVPSLHSKTLNPNIDFETTPFEVNQELREWEPAVIDGKAYPLRAGISSFGAGGSNTHIIVEEYQASESQYEPSVKAVIFPLSAKTSEQLVIYVKRVLTFLTRPSSDELRLEELAYTFQVGREAMETRAAFIVKDIKELVSKLKSFTVDELPIEGHYYQEQTNGHKDAMDALTYDDDSQEMIKLWSSKYKLDKLAQLWVSGLSFDWHLLYGDNVPHRVSAPTYPFSRQRYWCNQYKEHTSKVLPEASSQSLSKASQITLPSINTLWDPNSENNQSTTESIADADKPIKATQLRPALRPAFEVDPLKTEATNVDHADIKQTLRSLLAKVLFLEADNVDFDKKFIDLGLDSILGIEWIKKINQTYGLKLKATILYDQPTLTKLSHFLAKECKPATNNSTNVKGCNAAGTEKNSIQIVPEVSESNHVSEGIAIVGMSGKFPDAENIDQYWNNLVNGHSSITEIPSKRWSVENYYDQNREVPNKIYCKWGGFLASPELFDPLFFNISPAEAEVMDPQQRLFLETAWLAIENAGYATEQLSQIRCGVYAGVMNADYTELLQTTNRDYDAYEMMGNSHAILSSRIAYYLNLKGPAISIDTACSSSLVAVHLACEALRSGEIDMALCGGVTLYLTSRSYILMSKAGMLSAQGQCRTFDESADGFVPGEGVGVVVLKKLSHAQQDGDQIHGVIIGSGINQDGASNGITAPSVDAQVALETSVYDRFNIDPATISYVEAHGTGTRLGDPIEIDALSKAFANYTEKKQFCAIGSVKTNIGHTSAAAGVASLIKVLMCMRYEQLVPSLNCQNENQLIGFEEGPFYVSRKLAPWDVSMKRAAINSFGFSGTNSHVVVENPPICYASTNVQQVHYLMVLSAKSITALKQKVQQLLNYLQHASAKLVLADLQYTLHVCRDHFKHRFACVISDKNMLEQSLKDWLSDMPRDNIKQGTVGSSGPYTPIDKLQALLERTNHDFDELQYLAQAFVQGKPLDWGTLYRHHSYRRLSLPSYPFERKPFWINTTKEEDGAILTSTIRRTFTNLHPLIDYNSSTLERQSFHASLSCETLPYLADHIIGDQKIVAGCVLLEMMYAAALLSSESQTLYTLTDIRWRTPLILSDEEIELFIDLKVNSDNGMVLCQVLSSNREVVYAESQFNYAHSNGAKDNALPVVQDFSDYVEHTEFYQQLDSLGIGYGRSFRNVKRVDFNQTQAFVTLKQDEELSENKAYYLCPPRLDSVLQATSVLIDKEMGLCVPSALNAITLYQPGATICYANIIQQGHLVFDVELLDSEKRQIARLKGFTLTATTPDSSNEGHYQKVLDRLRRREITPEEALEFCSL